mgnify:CR=1 FL=1
MKFNKKDEGRSVSNMAADKYFYLILIVMRNALMPLLRSKDV